MITFRRIYQNDRGIWRLEFERDGRLFYFSLRTRIEAVARAKEDKFRRDVEAAEASDKGA